MRQSFVELLEANANHAREFNDRFDDVQDAQHPDVVSVCCSDSRVLHDHLWGNDRPGRVFTATNIGNRVVQRTDAGAVVSGDVLYPVEHIGTETVVVVGHTGCGAVTATYDALTDDSADASDSEESPCSDDSTGVDEPSGTHEPPGIEHCIGLLAPHLEAGVALLPDDIDRTEAVNRLVEYNVDRQAAFLLDSEDVPESVDVVGAVYDFQDVYAGRRGELHVVNVDGETDVGALEDAHPELRPRIERLWAY